MSRTARLTRYEFLEPGAEIVEGDDLLDLDEYFGPTDSAFMSDGQVALVMGNPWATAGVLFGTRESIAATLREWLALVEAAPPVVVEAGPEFIGQE